MKLEFYFVFLFMALLLSAKAQEIGDETNNSTTSSNQTQENETDSNSTNTEASNTTNEDNNATDTNSTENETISDTTDTNSTENETISDTNTTETNSTENETVIDTNTTETNSTDNETVIDTNKTETNSTDNETVSDTNKTETNSTDNETVSDTNTTETNSTDNETVIDTNTTSDTNTTETNSTDNETVSDTNTTETNSTDNETVSDTNTTETNSSDLISNETENITDSGDDLNTTNKTSDEDLDLKEAEKKMNISLSFRQISGFNYTSNKSEISFNFYGLTTEKLVEGYEILLRLFLILGDGTMDTNPTEAKCILNESITLEGEQTQADFECNITGLNETQEYKSFKLYDSKDIAGIPEDEILLDPVKTEEAIKDGILLDYSLEENKNKFPIYFNTETILPINGTYSPEGLNINIEGNIKQEIENETKINITLTYPKNYTAECTIPKTPVGKAYIYCLLKSNISSFVIIEQQILRDGLNEFLTIASGKYL